MDSHYVFQEEDPTYDPRPEEEEYTEFRADGWPLCPNCGLDELQNPHVHTNNLSDYINAGLWCLACHWESDNWKAAHLSAMSPVRLGW